MIKRKFLLSVFLFVVFGFSGFCRGKGSVYLFSYFKGNGEDGLHLACSFDGYKWEALKNDSSFLTPTAGTDKLMRDPCLIKGPDGRFHMVWTVSWNEKGLGYASSADLIHWTEQKYIPVMEHEPDALNCWAPEIFFDKSSGEYIIFWSTTIPGRFPETDSAGDQKYNHRMYYTTTSDFENFSPARLFYEHGFNVIDGTMVKEGGEYILFLKDETLTPSQKNIRIAKSKSPFTNFSAPSAPITGKYWAEGPTSVKIGKTRIVYFDKYREHSMGAVRSQDLAGWEDISSQISFPEGTRHGTVLKITKKEFNRLSGEK